MGSVRGVPGCILEYSTNRYMNVVEVYLPEGK